MVQIERSRASGTFRIDRRRAARVLFAAVVACAAAIGWAAGPISGDTFTLKRVFATAADFDACFRDVNIAVGSPAGAVALADSEILVNQIGNHLTGKAKFSPALMGKKVFNLDVVQAKSARLYVFSGPGKATFNGQALPKGTVVHTGAWTEIPVDATWLRVGANEVVFEEGFNLAQDAEAAPGKFSQTSRDGGKTWQPAAGGEFLVHLRLDRHPASGVITSDVIDAVNPEGKDGLCPLAEIGKLTVQCDGRVNDKAAIKLEARSGASCRPESSWSAWGPAEKVPPARYVQWRATLTTTDCAQTPVLKTVTVAAEGSLKADAAAGVKLDSFDNNHVVRGSYPYEFQRPSEKLTRLRTQWKLDEVVAPGKTEMDKFVLLRNWVRRQWPCNDNGSGKRTWDAIEILSAGPDQHGMCVHFANAFYQCALALGYNARPLILSNHFVADIWSDSYKKWVLMDVEAVHPEGFTKYGTAHYLDPKTRVPLTALEIHQRQHKSLAAKATLADDVLQMYYVDDEKGPHSVHEKVRPPGDLPYFRFCYPPRNNFLDKLEPWEQFHGQDHYHSDMYLWWRGGAPLARQPEYSRQTDRPADLYWSVNLVQMAMTASETSGEIDVTLDTVTPNFKCFVYRFNEGPWQTSTGGGADPDQRTGRLTWKLSAGANKLEVKPRNAFDRDGVVSSVIVTQAAPAAK